MPRIEDHLKIRSTLLDVQLYVTEVAGPIVQLPLGTRESNIQAMKLEVAEEKTKETKVISRILTEVIPSHVDLLCMQA